MTHRKSLTREQRRLLTVERITSDKRSRKVKLSFINKARNFFKKIGLPFVEVPSYIPDPEGCFFKGVWIADGKLHYCPARVDVGELLHEAGHVNYCMKRGTWLYSQKSNGQVCHTPDGKIFTHH